MGDSLPGGAGIIISDFDGVLAPQGETCVSGEALEAIEGFRELGYGFGLASGKGLGYLYGCCSMRGIDPDFIIAENGGVVYMDGRAEAHPSGDVARLRGSMLLDRGRVTGGPGARIVMEEEKDVIYTPHVEGGMEGAMEMKSYFEGIIDREGLELDVYAHPDGAVDVVPRGMSKVTGIEKVRKRHGEGRTIAIGDGTNDIEMLSYVDFPATVGNAHPNVEALVRGRNGYVAGSTNGRGFREIYSFIRDQGTGLLVPERGLAAGSLIP